MVLVIEDFHYLAEKEKVLLFQQWKRFIDNEISIIVLGTTHRAVDIANSNGDLIGRVSQIDIGRWSESDLAAICKQGFHYIKRDVPSNIIDYICKESVGLPIIVQQVCLQIFNVMNITSLDDARKSKFIFKHELVEQAMYETANEKYSQFSTYYNTLIRGPREKSRKYKTYEIVVACFTVDPISFHLTRSDIDDRISKLGLDSNEKPPPASLNSTLGALSKFQDRRDFQLLEWRPTEDTLYIVEPSFLFFVRWRKRKSSEKNIQLDFFDSLIKLDMGWITILDKAANRAANDP